MFVSEAVAQFDGPQEQATPHSHAAAAAELPLEHLEHEISQLAAHLAAGTCRWLELVAEFDRRQGWASWGCHCCSQWVAWRCGLTPRAAREHVRVAGRLAELPRIRDAFAAGRLSFSKVRALTRVANERTEEELLGLAENATAAQLERVVRGLRLATSEDAERDHEERYLSCWWESDGCLYLNGRLSAEDGALLLRALDAMHDRLRDRDRDYAGRGSAEPPADDAAGGSAEPPADEPIEPPEPARATHADALVAMADAALSAGGDAVGGRSGGERYQVVVHVDAATLRGSGDDPPHLDDGSSLAPETARRLACDASIVPLLADGAATLNVGRKTRSVPPALRRALSAREQRCAFPGCENRRFLDAHHIVHWAAGGETNLDNLIWLCRRHHRAVHEGGYSVARLADGRPRFGRPDGRSILDAATPPRGDPAAVPVQNRRNGRAIDEHTLQGGTGERLDLEFTVWTFAQHLERDRRNP